MLFFRWRVKMCEGKRKLSEKHRHRAFPIMCVWCSSLTSRLDFARLKMQKNNACYAGLHLLAFFVDHQCHYLRFRSLLAFQRIPWLFPALEKSNFFLDFSLTMETLSVESISLDYLFIMIIFYLIKLQWKPAIQMPW